jgi:hypothetical protein
LSASIVAEALAAVVGPRFWPGTIGTGLGKSIIVALLSLTGLLGGRTGTSSSKNKSKEGDQLPRSLVIMSSKIYALLFSKGVREPGRKDTCTEAIGLGYYSLYIDLNKRCHQYVEHNRKSYSQKKPFAQTHKDSLVL